MLSYYILNEVILYLNEKIHEAVVVETRVQTECTQGFDIIVYSRMLYAVFLL